jgi:hypothetical protein
VRETLNEAQTDGIVHEHENDRYGACQLCERVDCRRACRENRVRRPGQQFCRIGFVPIGIASGETIIDPDVAALDPTRACQSLRECRCYSLAERVAFAEGN